MTRHARELFERVGEAPREVRGHIPRIALTARSVRVTCSCGQLIGGGTGPADQAWLNYCIGRCAAEYERHVAALYHFPRPEAKL